MLRNQGWKDPEDSVFHADGTLCDSPVALIEVQRYYVAVLRAAASLFAEYGAENDAQAYTPKAETLVSKIDDAFWHDDLGTYCIALDAQNRQVRVSASNAGHLQFFGAVLPHRLNRLLRTLVEPTLQSG